MMLPQEAKMMTDERLAEIRARLKAATPDDLGFDGMAQVEMLNNAKRDLADLLAEVEQLQAYSDKQYAIVVARDESWNETLSAEIKHLRRMLKQSEDGWIQSLETSRMLAEIVLHAEATLPCGHPAGCAVIAGDLGDLGGPGTSYCGWCAAEAEAERLREQARIVVDAYQNWREGVLGSEDEMILQIEQLEEAL
jgi:hypothetical protein